MFEKMTPSEEYFYRIRGEWDWTARFDVVSWRKFFAAKIPFYNKFKLTFFLLLQKIIGPYEMWTCIGYQKNSDQVRHSLRILVAGVSFVRSEKILYLNRNSANIRLEGYEYYWPRQSKAVKIDAMFGSVYSSATRAQYQMQFMGTVSDCKTVFEPNEGSTRINTPWIKVEFLLKPKSMELLRQRFEQEHCKHAKFKISDEIKSF